MKLKWTVVIGLKKCAKSNGLPYQVKYIHGSTHTTWSLCVRSLYLNCIQLSNFSFLCRTVHNGIIILLALFCRLILLRLLQIQTIFVLFLFLILLCLKSTNRTEIVITLTEFNVIITFRIKIDRCSLDSLFLIFIALFDSYILSSNLWLVFCQFIEQELKFCVYANTKKKRIFDFYSKIVFQIVLFSLEILVNEMPTDLKWNWWIRSIFSTTVALSDYKIMKNRRKISVETIK